MSPVLVWLTSMVSMPVSPDLPSAARRRARECLPAPRRAVRHLARSWTAIERVLRALCLIWRPVLEQCGRHRASAIMIWLICTPPGARFGPQLLHHATASCCPVLWAITPDASWAPVSLTTISITRAGRPPPARSSHSPAVVSRSPVTAGPRMARL